MRIAICSDQRTHLTDFVVEEVKRRGHVVDLFGALSAETGSWPRVAVEVARHVASAVYDQGILFCWTGTGITLAANKVPGIRAALCHDAQTAAGARTWNDANILAMSLRATSEEVAKEMLAAWFATPFSDADEDRECIDYLKGFEQNR